MGESRRRPVSPQPSRVFRISYYWTTFHHHLGAWNRLGSTPRGLHILLPVYRTFCTAKLSRVSESCIFNYSFLFGFLFQIQYSSCSRKMFHLLISSSHKRLLCLPMSPCFPLRLSKKWGATVKIIFMIIFKSLYLQFIFEKMVCVILFLFFLLLFFRFYPILKRNKGINFSIIVFSLCCSLPFLPWLSFNWFVINPWKESDEVMNIWNVNCGLKNYMK